MSPMSLDEARDQLRDSEDRFRELQGAHERATDGLATPDRVLAEIEIRADLEGAARDLLAARTVFEAVERETADRQRERAEAELGQVQDQLVEVLIEAEAEMPKLVEILKRVLDLSKRRYAATAAAKGGASQRLLARSAVAGWTQHHLGGGLDLPDLGTAPHHYRLPLAEILGLGGIDDIDHEEEEHDES